MRFVVLFPLLILFSLSSPISSDQFPTDGTVLELDESNFDAAISAFDYIFVDFYAPWCSWSKRLAPELDKAAPILAGLKDPIIIAKIDVNKYTRLGRQYKINAYPTLKMFIHGIPTNYYGERDADILVQSLTKLVASQDAILDSHSII